MIHVSFHPGVGRFSGIEYCDVCGYSKQFIAATKMPCRRKRSAIEKLTGPRLRPLRGADGTPTPTAVCQGIYARWHRMGYRNEGHRENRSVKRLPHVTGQDLTAVWKDTQRNDLNEWARGRCCQSAVVHRAGIKPGPSNKHGQVKRSLCADDGSASHHKPWTRGLCVSPTLRGKICRGKAVPRTLRSTPGRFP